MKDIKTIGGRVKAMRLQRNLSQADVAESLGIARSTLAMIELDHDLPGRATMQAIADFYQISLDALMGEASRSPLLTQCVQTESEVALLRFWRDLSMTDRHVVLKLLQIRKRTDTAA